MPSTDCRCLTILTILTILTLMILHEIVLNLRLTFCFFAYSDICPLTWSGDVRSSFMARTEVVQFAADHWCRIFNRKPR